MTSPIQPPCMEDEAWADWLALNHSAGQYAARSACSDCTRTYVEERRQRGEPCWHGPTDFPPDERERDMIEQRRGQAASLAWTPARRQEHGAKMRRIWASRREAVGS